MNAARNVGRKDSDLAVRDLACGTRILPPHSARGLALLEKAGLLDHQDRVVIRQMLDDIIADDIAQSISIPVTATQDRLLPPWTWIAGCLRASSRSCVAHRQAGLPETSLHSPQHDPA